MKNKVLLLLAALLVSPALAATRAEVDKLAKELIAAEDAVTAFKNELKSFDAKHSDPKALTEEQAKTYEKILSSLEKAEKHVAETNKKLSAAELTLASAPRTRNERNPAAGKAFEHVNGKCPLVDSALEFAGPTSWTPDGKLVVEGFEKLLHETFQNNRQSLQIRGSGVAFRAYTKRSDKYRTKVSLSLDEGGKLQKLELTQSPAIEFWENYAVTGRKKSAESRLSQEYDWKGDECELKKVTVDADEIPNGTGVSYDRELCRAMEAKGLLDEKKIDECSDFNDQIGNEIEKAMKANGGNTPFVLYTTAANGKTQLKEWKKGDHLSVNAAIARDCTFNFRKGGRAPGQPSNSNPNPNPDSNPGGNTAR